MERRKRRKKSFFMAILLVLVLKVFLAKIDIFGFRSIGTGFCDMLVIAIASYIISSLPTKNRLLAYSIFSFGLGIIILAFKSRIVPFEKILSPFSVLYFLDTLMIFSIYLMIRTEKRRKKEAKPAHPKVVYALLLLFSVLSVLNIVSVKASALDASEKAKKLGIFAYSISNPSMYIKANADSASTAPSTGAQNGNNGTTGDPIQIPSVTTAPAESSNTSATPIVNGEPASFAGIAKGKNVILIQWEALQDLPVNRTLNGIELTPNLNKLIKDSVYYKNGISQISKGTTSDAEFAVTTSLYPMANASAFETMADRKYIGLPYLMGKAGYTTSTFHTNTATFWNRSNMYPLLGWKKWYDRPFFGGEYIVGFGACDYVLFSKAIPELVKYKASGKPFFTQLITVSSHNPFEVPGWMRTVHFGADIDTTIVGKYLRTINYADRQLGMFISDLKKNGLYDDSLIVLYGDHFGLSESKMAQYGLKTNMGIVKDILGRDYDKLDTLNVPIVFKLPNSLAAKTVDMPAGQVDIMPTVLSLTGVENKDGKMFGNDLLSITENKVGVRYYAPPKSFADNTQFYVGNEYAIRYDHVTVKIKEDPTTESTPLYEKISASDAYVKGLKKLK